MRTFLALDLPDPIRLTISDLISKLQAKNVAGINWVKLENLHITFQFIGNTNQHDFTEILDVTAEIFSQMRPVHFSNPALQLVPLKDPRIIWIDLHTNHKKIFKASHQLRDKLQKMGYKLDNKPLNFHITLGRIKKRLPDFLIREILTTELKLVDFEISEAALYRSILKPEGPIYDKIAKYVF